MGIADHIAPSSDQLDAVDLLTGPRTFTISRVVVRQSGDQPVDIHLEEFPRPWRPGKSMRRVLVRVWGGDEQAYVGRRVTLFCEPRVQYGGKEVGGTRISHMSHIDQPVSVPLIVSKGRSATYVVQPLIESPGAAVAPPDGKPAQVAPDVACPTSDTAPGVTVTREDIAACESIPQLRDWWKQIPNEEARSVIDARVKELEQAALGDDQ